MRRRRWLQASAERLRREHACAQVWGFPANPQPP